jgi:predicted metal-dependent phosphoesterase TrpH
VGKADLHVHTASGDGMAAVPELLAHVEEQTDLSVVAITEHDTLRPALEAREAHARSSYRFDLVVGEEVTTIEGHLLALYIEEPVKGLQRLAPTLEAIHRQGGLAVIPHPMSWLTRSLGRRDIERVLKDTNDGMSFDAIEIGASPAARQSRAKAQRLNRERFHLPEVGGSDAHFLEVIGASHTLFDGTSAAELRRAIETGATSVGGAPYPSFRQIGLRNIVVQQYRGMMATPRQMGWLPTIGSFVKRALP